MPKHQDYDWMDCRIHGWSYRKDCLRSDGDNTYLCPVSVDSGDGDEPCLHEMTEVQSNYVSSI
jgi:hypothetical protein